MDEDRDLDATKDSIFCGKNNILIIGIIVVIILIFIFIIWKREDNREYGIKTKIREKYENTVDTIKAKAVERRRKRIAEHNNLNKY